MSLRQVQTRRRTLSAAVYGNDIDKVLVLVAASLRKRQQILPLAEPGSKIITVATTTLYHTTNSEKDF